MTKLLGERVGRAHLVVQLRLFFIGASVSEPHLGSSTRPLSVCLYIYISYVRHFWSRGPRAMRKCKPAHLKFKGHMHADQQRRLEAETCIHMTKLLGERVGRAHLVVQLRLFFIGASVSEPHLGSSTRPLSVCLYIYISYVRHFWSRGPRAMRKCKPAHLKFKGHMHAV